MLQAGKDGNSGAIGINPDNTHAYTNYEIVYKKLNGEKKDNRLLLRYSASLRLHLFTFYPSHFRLDLGIGLRF
jgi:hypothetical protein